MTAASLVLKALNLFTSATDGLIYMNFTTLYLAIIIMFVLFLDSITEEPTLGEQLVALLLLLAMTMMLPLMNMVRSVLVLFFPVSENNIT